MSKNNVRTAPPQMHRLIKSRTGIAQLRETIDLQENRTEEVLRHSKQTKEKQDSSTSILQNLKQELDWSLALQAILVILALPIGAENLLVPEGLLEEVGRSM